MTIPEMAIIPIIDINPIGCLVISNVRMAPISPNGPVIAAITIFGISCRSNMSTARMKKIIMGSGFIRSCNDSSDNSRVPPFSSDAPSGRCSRKLLNVVLYKSEATVSPLAPGMTSALNVMVGCRFLRQIVLISFSYEMSAKVPNGA